MTQKESAFQAELKKQIEEMFPGAVVIKQDPNIIQAFPDLLVLYKTKWVALETKRASDSEKQVNQEYWVNRLGKMSYAAFVHPENLAKVLADLRFIFKGVRSRLSIRDI